MNRIHNLYNLTINMMFYELLFTIHSLINTTNTQPIQDHAHTHTYAYKQWLLIYCIICKYMSLHNKGVNVYDVG